MGWYANWIFPRVMDLVMSGRDFRQQRSELLSECSGDVLEIGFGTGLNLSHYPSRVRQLTVIDPAVLLPGRVERRIREAPIPIERVHLSAEKLPFDRDRFDVVVSTWTLCTIPDVTAALQEVRRVLRPGGRFLFVEHGRSQDHHVARRQDRWNWLQNIVGQGCHLNRPIGQLIAESGLATTAWTDVPMPGPRILREHVRGVAVKS